eukprot:jgi/Mesen1/5961/ME000301S05081
MGSLRVLKKGVARNWMLWTVSFGVMQQMSVSRIEHWEPKSLKIRRELKKMTAILTTDGPILTTVF